MTVTTGLESLLEKGIGAYKQGDYTTAEQALTQLIRSKSSTYRLKASMGLTRIYIAQQRWPEAQRLCQQIGSSSKPALQAWASNKLSKIEQRIAETSPDIETEQPASDAYVSEVLLSQKSALDASGFQPLSSNLKRGATNTSDKSVVSKIAVNKAATVSPSPDKMTRSPKKSGENRIERPFELTSVEQNRHREESCLENPVEGLSMFHYAYLNGEEHAVAESDEHKLPSGDGFVWSNAGRLKQGRSIGKVKKTALIMPQLLGSLGFYGLLHFGLESVVGTVDAGLNWLDRLLPFRVQTLPYAFNNLTWPLFIVLLIVAAASPWLWDTYLLISNRQSLSVSQLRSHSPESATIIHRYCRQHRWPFPKLWKLPIEMPLIFSYGWLPRTARLVISDGLLTELKEDEIAALVAYEMSQWKSAYWPLISVQGLIFQSLLQFYWSLSVWADLQIAPIKYPVGLVANIAYASFWVLRLPTLWIARARTYYSDRAATEITGNPNALIRGLSKLSFAIAAHLQHQTPVFLEALTPLLPISADLSRHQLYGRLPLAQLFSWDSTNPLRHWLSCTEAHPPLGDRLRILAAYAQHWKLTPEISFPALGRQRKGMSAQNWSLLLKQSAPYLSLTIGLAIGLLLWLLGAIGIFFKLPALDWMYKDIALLQGCLLLGFSVGTLLRINRFFPDLSPSTPQSVAIADWLSNSKLLPADSLPTKLEGTLIGRPGVANWLGQDLMLKTQSGLFKLHFLSILGPLGNILTLSSTPAAYQGKSVQVLGWFRRGNRPWLDVNQLRPVKIKGQHTHNAQPNVVAQAAHPVFSLTCAAIACALGLWALLGNPF